MFQFDPDDAIVFFTDGIGYVRHGFAVNRTVNKTMGKSLVTQVSDEKQLVVPVFPSQIA